MAMKKIVIIVGCFLCFVNKVQSQQKVAFEYVKAGNQISRAICLHCRTAENIVSREISEIKNEEYQKDIISDKIAYYPNPVKEQLYLKWETTDNNIVTIEVVATNGQTIKSIKNLQGSNTYVLEFGAFPNGVYVLVVKYKNGEEKTFKIIKE